MKWLKILALHCGLLREDEIDERREALPRNVLVIPPQAVLAGTLRSNIGVVVSGTFTGGIEIAGDALVVVAEGGKVQDGPILADSVLVHGTLTNAEVEVDSIYVSERGVIDGPASRISYVRFAKHTDAPVTALLRKRNVPREAFGLVTRVRDHVRDHSNQNALDIRGSPLA